MRKLVDVLVVRGDTTLGLKLGDDTLIAALERLDCTIAQVTPRYRLTRLLRATKLAAHLGVMPDLTEALDARRAASGALRAFDPTCLIYSPGFTAVLQPHSRLAIGTAIRFDSPPSMSREGRRGAGLLRALERRAFRRTQLLLPWGVHPRNQLLEALPATAHVIPLPVPVATPGEERTRSPIAVTYASANPQKKGLDIVLAAWEAASPSGMRLTIAGIEPSAGKRWCARHRIPVPDSVDWVGRLEPHRWHDLLDVASIYLAASRYEDYGIAQLEALARGTLLVTVPSAGPFEPLSLAEKLPGSLVAIATTGAALAEALTRAINLPDEVRATYRAAARGLAAPYSEALLDRRLRQEVLPLLLRRDFPA